MGQQELELCPKKEALPRTRANEVQGSLAGEGPGNPTPPEPVPDREEGGAPPTNTGGRDTVMAVRFWLKLSSCTWSETGSALKHPFSQLSQAEGRESEAVGGRGE